MAAITISRLSPDELKQQQIPYTIIPNFLIYCAELGLKPRDTAVFNYLYSQNADKFKTLQPSAIANALGIGVSTVRRALSMLVKAGFASFKRFADGKTAWKVSLPAALFSDAKPHSQKPHLAKPQVENSNILERNNLLEKNKETTNVVDLPDYVNTGPVKQELSALEKTQQLLVLKVLTLAMTAGKVKNPIGYVIELAKKAKDGVLSSPVDNAVDKQSAAVEKANARFDFIRRNAQKLWKQTEQNGFVNILEFGNITRDEIRPFLSVA